MQKTFTGFSRKNIKAIHALSVKYNELKKRKHGQVLLELMDAHAKEIALLYKNKNKHYIVETGDLLILCLELLEEARVCPDIILDKCYKRYYEKLSGLIEESKKQQVLK